MLLTTIAITRLLPQSEVAVVILGQAIAAYVVIVVDFGYSTAGIRAVSQTEDRAKVIASVLIGRLALAVIAVTFVAAFSILYTPGIVAQVYVLSAVAVAAAVFDISWAAQGAGHPSLRGFTAAISGAGTLVLVVVLLLAVRDARMVPLGVLAAGLLASCVGFVGTTRLLGHPALPSWQGLRQLSAVALPFGIASVLAQAYYNFDLLFIGIVRPVAEVATYGALYKIILGLQMLSITYGSLWLPKYARSVTDSPASFTADLRDNLIRLAIIIAPVTIYLVMFGREGLSFLFGAGYADGGMALGILGISVLFAFLSGTIISALSAAGDGWFVSRAIALATAANIGLNLILIPNFGMTGAAVTTALSEAIVLAALGAGRASVRAAVRAADLGALIVPAIGAVATAWIAGNFLPWWLAAMIATVVYAGWILSRGCWPRSQVPNSVGLSR
jgi:O-antigen/teichoic acid export membrane protein